MKKGLIITGLVVAVGVVVMLLLRYGNTRDKNALVLFSGFMFAISNMPIPLQVISRIIPARYFIVVLKGIFLKGNPFRILVMDAIFLLVIGIAVFVVANIRFQKKLT
jgi:ABC-type multidrug transport system permease subunit